MEIELIIVVSVLGVVALGVILALALRLYKTQAQLRRMTKVLTDLESGHGHPKLLVRPGDPTAPIAYQINQIVATYEEQLAARQRSDEAHRQLMTSLSHDVRTPLTTLIGYLDAACQGTVTGEEREQYLRVAEQKAQDLKAYIDTLFDWFKLNSDEFVLSPAPTEITELTREALKDWIPVLEENGIAFDIAIPEAPCRVQLDADAYQRVINNLVQNVVAHSQASQIKITLKTSTRQASLTVTDNGVGIAKSDLQHIFERLYKCDTGRSGKGSGLGLAITKQIVEKMGGTITATSRPKQGTKFRVCFPTLVTS